MMMMTIVVWWRWWWCGGGGGSGGGGSYLAGSETVQQLGTLDRRVLPGLLLYDLGTDDVTGTQLLYSRLHLGNHVRVLPRRHSTTLQCRRDLAVSTKIQFVCSSELFSVSFSLQSHCSTSLSRIVRYSN